ncbi:hypothetical protein [Pseudomonas aeruginosa]|uniref:hypothetical protein n=1 Tax=Pseudomonas TaxID=286 RepID=UPI00044B25BE|nr:hypothetical protein [Pseudomonas aeruginosa]EIU7172026.1 hypothetical protein [Pseudomonas aeruginosa]EMA4483184.1 hypothetical protein [Pseudomonas aeruginosa]EZO01921.1 hypothetical protein AJ66_03005 [Pseudomonas aeruginosa 3579]EZO13033.1 hypothetical protein AJ65_02713 [Pseudomonas aeruginosa 3578]MBA5357252.1 hypothetical protein [Pseudomonas aeruginosa]
MGLVLIIPLLVSGFLVYHHHPVHFYKLHRHEGQYLYIQCARLGLYSLIISFLICTILYHLLTYYRIGDFDLEKINLFSWTAKHLANIGIVKKEESTTYALFIWAIILSLWPIPHIWGSLTRFFFFKLRLGAKNATQTKVAAMAQIFKDSPLDDFLFKSAINKDTVMLHMDDRKVYVGFITTMGEPNETQGADQEIAIKPVMSGYRDKDTLTVTFTTQYREVGADVTLILRQEEIISATKFDSSVYEKFQASKPRN